MSHSSVDMYIRYSTLWLWLVLLSLLPLSSSAQPTDEGLNFKHLTVDDGLSHATVNSILEDRHGMLWIATRHGLNRFDGYNFKTYLHDPTSESYIRAYIVLSLWEDQSGNIWSGYLNGGISVLERSTGRFRRFPFNDDQTIDWNTISVRSIYEDKRGNIWVGTFGGGAVVFDQAGNQLAHFCTYCEAENRKLSNDFVFDFTTDKQERIWIGTAGKGLNLYDPQQDQIQQLYSEDSSTMTGFGKSLALSPQGAMWVGTAGNGLYVIDPLSLGIQAHYQAEPQGVLPSAMITDIEWDATGQLWLATDGGGLAKHDPTTGQWTNFQYAPAYPGSLNTNALYDLHFDTRGNLWVGTFNGGINVRYTQPPPFAVDRKYAEEQALGLRSVLSMAHSEDSTIWLGTDGAGLFQLNLQDGQIKLESTFSATTPQVITSILAVDGHRLWLGTFAQGLVLFDSNQGVIRNYQYQPADSTSLSHNNVWDLACEANGNLWVGTLGGGINLLASESNKFQHFQPRPNGNGLSSVQVTDILLDTLHQALWVATEDAGLNRIDLHTHEIVQYRHDSADTYSISSDQIQCLYQNRSGTLFIGTTYDGLCVFNPKTGQSINYGQANGLPSNSINNIVEGPDGLLWISSLQGIGRWDPETLTFEAVGTDPYLKNNQYNPRAALRTIDDRLLFGSTNGYALVLPERLPQDTMALHVWFTHFSLSSQTVEIGKINGRTILNGPLNDSLTTVQLRYDDKGISFWFAANDFAQVDKVKFAYRLMGLDTSWQVVSGEQRFANYAALPSGTYELQVRAIDRNGSWSPQLRSLRIEVAPPFWQTWWFTVMCIVLGTSIVIGILIALLSRQRARYERQAIEAEQEILRLQNENLEKDVANKQAQLSASVMQIAHKNEILNTIQAKLKDIPQQATPKRSNTLRSLQREIAHELIQEDYWEQFQLAFDQSFQDFMQQIQAAHPKLSANDHRFCCFIKMRLRNKEIASILNITVNGVEQAKYRLKKKIGLQRDENLNQYIQTFGQV